MTARARRAAPLALLLLPLAGCVTPGGGWSTPAPDPSGAEVEGADEPRTAGAGENRLAAQLERAAAPAAGARYIFVGVAMSDRSSAFYGDIRILDRIFSHQYGEAYRSILLANGPQYGSIRDLPLATPRNIAAVFARLARIRAPEDRFIVLFTSHGAPSALSDHQEEVGANWLVGSDVVGDWVRSLAPNRTWVLVSACYSGSLLGELQGANVMIMTASDEERTSLGCGDSSRNTFFVGALASSLDFDRPFQEVWSDANRRLRTWEREYRYETANPQARFGADLRPLRQGPLSAF